MRACTCPGITRSSAGALPRVGKRPFVAETIPLRVDTDRVAMHAARQAERGGAIAPICASPIGIVSADPAAETLRARSTDANAPSGQQPTAARQSNPDPSRPQPSEPSPGRMARRSSGRAGTPVQRRSECPRRRRRWCRARPATGSAGQLPRARRARQCHSVRWAKHVLQRASAGARAARPGDPRACRVPAPRAEQSDTSPFQSQGERPPLPSGA